MVDKRKLVICGTHPAQFNGYSKVLHEICNGLSTEYASDLDVYIFGFQNFNSENMKKEHVNERNLDKVKEIYDVYAHEEPKKKGFGEDLIAPYLEKIKPDIVVIYNDLIVISSLLQRISKIETRTEFKVIPYIDLVYQNERNDLIKFINDNVDGGITFGECWSQQLKKQNFTKPLTSIPHGFNPLSHFPIERKVARLYYGIPDSDIVIVNLNRNQPRKRWDICLMAFVKYVSQHLGGNVKLLIGTSMNGAWDLMDIIISECRKNNITLEDIKKHIIVIPNPQQLTDKEINVLYNIGDIGLNTCDGEGFGLCNFEQAGLGIPQVLSKVGGFTEIFHKSNSILITPKWTYYVDKSRDVVGGEAQVCDVDDFVRGIEFYVSNETTRISHGKKSREHILKNYSWKTVVKHFYYVIMSSTTDLMKEKKRIQADKEKKEKEKEHEKTATSKSQVSGDAQKRPFEITPIEDVDIEELIRQRYSTNKTPSASSSTSTSTSTKGVDDEDFFIIEG